MGKRITESDEYERVAERVHTQHSRRVKDRDSFNAAFYSVLGSSELSGDQEEFRDKVFNSYRRRYDIQSDVQRRKTVAKIYSREEKQKYDTLGSVKGRITYSRKVSVVIKGNRITKYRDKKGRFVAVKYGG